MRNVDRRLFLLAALLLMAHTGRTQTPPTAKLKKSAETSRASGRASTARAKRLPPEAEKWVRDTLGKMTLDEKVGQVIFATYHGALLSTESANYAELLHAVEKLHVGGFIVVTTASPLGVVKSQAYPAAVLANQLQRRARIPLLIGADFERGTTMRLDEGTSFPTAMALAAGGRPEDAYAMGRITALEARAVGVQWIYAPVADVNSNPANPIINTRSFGEDARRVSEYVAAFVRGVEDNGALATAKHFPGHGDTLGDTHLDLATVRSDRAHLDAVELVPFRAAVRAGVSAVMTGHLAVPALEPDPDVPATLSPNILTGLLRQNLGFDGLVVTDAMDMGGVMLRYPPGEAAVRAIEAGADALLMPPVPDAAFEALKSAVLSGRISRAHLDASVRRILRAKARLGLHKKKLVDVEALNRNFARPEWARAAQEISDRGVTLLRDSAGLFPLDPAKPLRALLVAISGDPEPYPAEDLERELRARVDSLEVVRTDTKFVKVGGVSLPPPDQYDVAVVALFVRVSDRKGNVDLLEDQAALARKVLAAGKPAVVISFGSPYVIEDFPNAPAWLSVFGIADVSQISAARALFGEIEIGGRLPVSIPGAKLKAGDGLHAAANPAALRPMPAESEARLKRAFDVMDRAVTAGAFPGGVLAVGYRGEMSVRAFGSLTYDAKSPRVQPATIYDVASLTKPVVTATLAAMLVERGALGLDRPIGSILPEFNKGPRPEWRGKITLRHLLTHTSGLPPHVDYYKTAKNKQDILKRIFQEPLVSEPGAQVAYSDLGIILLGEIIERVTGRSLDALARERILTPLGMKDSQFRPDKRLRARIAPTENDASYRKRLVRGEVHDENAWAMGGVAGHAGLFSTAPDLAAFCRMMLNGGWYAHRRLLRRATLEQFTARQPLAGGKRALGWDVPADGSMSGRLFSARSFGHSGFTGTSIWIDPDKEVFVILLTNRVHPTRENNKVREVRPALHDAVIEALGLRPAARAQK